MPSKYSQMKKQNLQLESSTCDILIKMCEVMKQRSPVHEDIDIQPNVVTYNTHISNFVKSGDSHNAIQKFTEMKQQNIEPNILIYNTLIQMFVESGDSQNACNLFVEMKQQNVAPDVVTYNTLIKMFENEKLSSTSLPHPNSQEILNSVFPNF